MQKKLQKLGGGSFITTRVSVSYLTQDSAEEVASRLMLGNLLANTGSVLVTQATISETRTIRLRMLPDENSK